jgi:hypothetical protein
MRERRQADPRFLIDRCIGHPGSGAR